MPTGTKACILIRFEAGEGEGFGDDDERFDGKEKIVDGIAKCNATGLRQAAGVAM